MESIRKYDVKFDNVVITAILNQQEATSIQNIGIRTGKVHYAVHFGYHFQIVVFELVGSTHSPTQIKES